MVYFCFWIMGAGCLLTWSALMCTFPYLVQLFPPDSTRGRNLPSTLSSFYCFGLVVFMGLAQNGVGRGSPSKRLNWSSSLLLISSILFTFPLLPLLLPHLTSTLLLLVLIAFTLLFAHATSYFQSSVLGLSSLWGSSQVLAVMSGQGGVAVLVSFAQLSLAVLAAFRPSSGEEEGKMGLVPSVGLWILTSLGAGLCLLAFRYLSRRPEYERVVELVSNREETKGDGEGILGGVLRKNALVYVAVAYTFAVTLSVFPAITTTITSTHHPTPRLLQPDVFIPLHFLIFNLGDYIGRTYLPLIPSILITSHPRILILALSRTLFIPLFLACNTSTTIPLINSDILYFLIALTCGLSNGYIGSMCMIVATTPSLNPRISEEEKDFAGTLGAFFLVGGLALGSVASFGVKGLVG
ncbi:hypothetical protein TREMEDRAFT_43819 [Tremella mesenterica DSM 1558]|nr:uncharacterized protein TREMEDRAFT_43819 [Tremella mesenterica DSM 1558]EIW70227.1 hypothetical protein TREMEDRAFT_43819 [Tremella mesenterica DSM 1558]